MTNLENPFGYGSDRWAIWDMVVRRDIEAFSAGDWQAAEADFIREGFMGLDAGGRLDPDTWSLAFPTLDDYREAWQTQRREILGPASVIYNALFAVISVSEIDLRGDSAVVHKKFDGWIAQAGRPAIRLDWQTLYFCRRTGSGWKIGGFVGYLPCEGLSAHSDAARSVKQVPPAARQHVTAGPYSPVLTVHTDELVVISGQAAIANDGRITGHGIREQAREALQNCRAQLASAGCSLQDVFKVNVYLADLADWTAFNEVYAQVLPEPRPVRTCVGAALLPGLVVEMEMWAARPTPEPRRAAQTVIGKSASRVR